MLRRIFRLVVLGRDATELFEAVEHPFDAVSTRARPEVVIGTELR
jgi:hypothetical protein